MTQKLLDKKLVKGLRRWGKRLEELADDFERHPKETRRIIESVTIEIKFNLEHFFPKITKL